MIDYDIIVSVLIIGAAFMLGLLLFTAQLKNRRGNIFLGLFLWNLVYLELQTVVENYLELKLYFSFDGRQFILVFLFMYLITTINRPFKKWYLLLFVPGLFVNLVRFTSSVNYDELDFHYLDFFNLFYLIELFLIVYFFKILKKHKIKVNEFYSNMELKTLSWIKGLVFLVLLLHISFIVEGILLGGNQSTGVGATIIMIIIYWIGYNGFSQPEIFKGGFFYNKKEKGKAIVTNVEVSHKEFDLLKERIIEERLYAKQKLTLRDLASSLNMKEKEISFLINQYSGTTFYHFINRFRVEEFKKVMKSSKFEQLSVFGLAQEVGFSSKSTFYAAFKAVEGKTPKQVQLSLKESE